MNEIYNSNRNNVEETESAYKIKIQELIHKHEQELKTIEDQHESEITSLNERFAKEKEDQVFLIIIYPISFIYFLTFNIH